MKTVVKLKIAALIALMAWSINGFSQATTMYVMKNGEIVFQSPVSGIDNVTFDGATPNNALFVYKNENSSTDKILLNNILQFSFSDENLSVGTSTGNEMYAFSDIAKLLFGDINTNGINNPSAQSTFDVLVSVTQVGDVIVETSVAIKSLILFSIEGKMISKQYCNGVETQCITSLQNSATGIYLLRVETEQGTVIKKVVKS